MISWHFKSVFWEQQVLILDALIEILHFTLDPDPNHTIHQKYFSKLNVMWLALITCYKLHLFTLYENHFEVYTSPCMRTILEFTLHPVWEPFWSLHFTLYENHFGENNSYECKMWNPCYLNV